MIGMIMAGVAVAQGVSKYMKGRKEKKWGRRNAAAARAKAESRLQKQDKIIDQLGTQRAIAQQDLDRDRERYDEQGFDQVGLDLAQQVQDGVDVDGIANTAADTFTNQYDVSLDAQRRQMQAQGVRPGSQAMARLAEDSAYDRARGAASAGNTARRQADDMNFARRVAYTQQGTQARNRILDQGANIAASYRAEYGMQGEMRGQFKGEQRAGEQRAKAGSQMMSAGVSQAIGGVVGLGGAGAFGSTVQQGVQTYTRAQQGMQGMQAVQAAS